jgi:hypothetical protein
MGMMVNFQAKVSNLSKIGNLLQPKGSGKGFPTFLLSEGRWA